MKQNSIEPKTLSVIDKTGAAGMDTIEPLNDPVTMRQFLLSNDTEEAIKQIATGLTADMTRKVREFKDNEHEPESCMSILTTLLETATRLKAGCPSNASDVENLVLCAAHLRIHHEDDIWVTYEERDNGGRENCRGCQHLKAIGDDHVVCLSAKEAPEKTIEKPSCFIVSEEFMEAVNTLDDLLQTLGEGHPATLTAWAKLISVCPPVLKDNIEAEAKASGLMPEPSSYDDNGNPLFSIESIAEKLGCSVNEVITKAQALAEAGQPIFHTGNIHKVQ